MRSRILVGTRPGYNPKYWSVWSLILLALGARAEEERTGMRSTLIEHALAQGGQFTFRRARHGGLPAG
jgi:hypothetical protein